MKLNSYHVSLVQPYIRTAYVEPFPSHFCSIRVGFPLTTLGRFLIYSCIPQKKCFNISMLISFILLKTLQMLPKSLSEYLYSGHLVKCERFKRHIILKVLIYVAPEFFHQNQYLVHILKIFSYANIHYL
jgi:hypothetical protein